MDLPEIVKDKRFLIVAAVAIIIAAVVLLNPQKAPEAATESYSIDYSGQNLEKTISTSLENGLRSEKISFKNTFGADLLLFTIIPKELAAQKSYVTVNANAETDFLVDDPVLLTQITPQTGTLNLSLEFQKTGNATTINFLLPKSVYEEEFPAIGDREALFESLKTLGSVALEPEDAKSVEEKIAEAFSDPEKASEIVGLSASISGDEKELIASFAEEKDSSKKSSKKKLSKNGIIGIVLIAAILAAILKWGDKRGYEHVADAVKKLWPGGNTVAQAAGAAGLPISQAVSQKLTVTADPTRLEVGSGTEIKFKFYRNSNDVKTAKMELKRNTDGLTLLTIENIEAEKIPSPGSLDITKESGQIRSGQIGTYKAHFTYDDGSTSEVDNVLVIQFKNKKMGNSEYLSLKGEFGEETFLASEIIPLYQEKYGNVRYKPKNSQEKEFYLDQIPKPLAGEEQRDNGKYFFGYRDEKGGVAQISGNAAKYFTVNISSATGDELEPFNVDLQIDFRGMLKEKGKVEIDSLLKSLNAGRVSVFINPPLFTRNEKETT
ncbi:MAG TPA: hypothetical protein VFF09_01875, partial [archaeon]|nr:hypothetical protein [archaeon]